MFEAIYSYGVLFVSCEIGHQLSSAFDECSDMIDQLNWYLFPAEIQRMLPIITNFAQQPIVFYCFGSTACTRETYKRVRINRLLYINYYPL